LDQCQRRPQTRPVGNRAMEQLPAKSWPGQRRLNLAILCRVRRQIHQNPRRYKNLGGPPRPRRLCFLRWQSIIFIKGGTGPSLGETVAVPFLFDHVVWAVQEERGVEQSLANAAARIHLALYCRRSLDRLLAGNSRCASGCCEG